MRVLAGGRQVFCYPREGSRECGEGEGDCSLDSDCSGSLVCGTDNCLQQFSKSGERWGPGDDCCTRWPRSIIQGVLYARPPPSLIILCTRPFINYCNLDFYRVLGFKFWGWQAKKHTLYDTRIIFIFFINLKIYISHVN